MRYVVDTNIVLDAMLGRDPFRASAALLLELGYLKEFELWIGSSQLSDLVYFISDGGKSSLAAYARNTLGTLCACAHIYATSEEDVLAITSSTWSDLEDALVFQTALQVRADAIVTRDKTGFERSHIPVFDCEGLFAHIAGTQGIDYAEIAL